MPTDGIEPILEASRLYREAVKAFLKRQREIANTLQRGEAFINQSFN